MRRIKDRKLALILATGGCPGISKNLASGAYWMASLLLAARGWSTIGGFAQVARLSGGRFAAQIDGRWAITFAWDWDVNRAFELKLEYL